MPIARQKHQLNGSKRDKITNNYSDQWRYRSENSVINIKKPREGFWFLSGEEAEIIRLQRGFELKERKRKGRWSKKKKKREMEI